jgi:hypothetical protein
MTIPEQVCPKNGCKSYRKFINQKKLEQCNNKHYKNVIDPNLVFTNLHQSDDNMTVLTLLHNNIINPYEIKINLLKYVIQNPDFKIGSSITNIKDFFNTLNPLNIEFQMGSYVWSYKCINNNGKELLLVQNSLFKKNVYNTPNVYTDYIDLIKLILDRSGVTYSYHEFRTKRFYKRVDTIFLFYK